MPGADHVRHTIVCARRLRELFRPCSHSQRHESDSEARLQEAAFNLTPGMTPSTDDMIRGIRCTRRRGRPDSRRLIALSSQWMPREDATHRGTRYLPASGCSLTHGLAWTAFTSEARDRPVASTILTRRSQLQPLAVRWFVLGPAEYHSVRTTRRSTLIPPRPIRSPRLQGRLRKLLLYIMTPVVPHELES